MDVSRAHLHIHLLFFLAPRTTAHNRFLSPCTYHQFPLEKDVFNFMLFVGSRSSHPRPAVSLKQGHSTTSSKGLCEVVWTIEANLSGDQLLYLTGDPVVLGCWQSENAILMYPTEHANLWKAKVKIPSGISFKYNYLIKETWPSHGIIWRPGPEFSLLVPLMVKQDRNVMVRDSWTKYNTERFPDNAWGSWIEETHLAAQHLTSASTKDEHEIVKHHETDLTEPKPFQKDLRVNGKLCFDGDMINAKNGSINSVFSERNQPVEEPWSFQPSFLLLISKDRKVPEFPKDNNPVEHDETKLEIVNQHFKVKDKPLPAAGSDVDNPYSTILLINSSICTMQRIAILEDGKLVELLLEPVKTDVQCDSVYLGVVTKLVPHMGGAFVNIGSSRPSLMDIKPNREPFIFPPFRQRRKKQKINGSVLEANEEQLALNEKKHTADDAEVIDDVDEFVPQLDLASFMHYDHEEHEIDDDFDVTEVKKNVNGSIVEYSDEVQADFEHFLDGRETNLGGKTVNGSLPVEIEASNNYLLSRPRKKDDKNILTNENKWSQVRKGTKIVVQVVKEGLGTKGPTLTAYPKMKSRFWVLDTRCDRIGVSKKVSGLERTRLKVIAKTLKPPGFGLTVRTVASGHSLEELQKDLEGLLSTWKSILEQAKSAALAADEGVEGSIPVILHRAMGQTLSVVQDYFNEKVKKMVVDSPRTYHEVTNYLQEIAPDLCDRVELYDKRNPIFDEFNIEDEINNILSKKVPLPDGGSLVIEQTEALVSIDVNGGHVMFGHGTSQEKAVLDVNLAAAKQFAPVESLEYSGSKKKKSKLLSIQWFTNSLFYHLDSVQVHLEPREAIDIMQIARELRLRDIGGIIVVDFIGMMDDSHKRLVYEEMKRAVERDRSMVKVSELSRHGLMEITRKRVRPSVTFMISEPCTCCHATGRVEALDTSFSKIEQEICRVLATMDLRADLENPKTWPRFLLRVDYHMCNYLTSGKRTRLAILSSSLKVWILLKVSRGFTRGAFELKPYTDDKMNKDEHQIALSILRRAETRSNNSGRKVTLVPVKKGKLRGK